jgi:hypothetical protein
VTIFLLGIFPFFLEALAPEGRGVVLRILDRARPMLINMKMGILTLGGDEK